MKALAIDSAVTCISLAACNQQKKASVTLDIGMRQSEKLIPAIEYVLEQVELDTSQLDFIALSGGPGSFTGLRLGFAAAKGLQLSTGCPVYSIPTLQAQAEPYSSWPGKVISAIDAKKDRFYVQIFFQGKEIGPSQDIGIEEIAQQLDENDQVLIVGPDSEALLNRLQDFNPSLHLCRFPSLTSSITDALFSMGSKATKTLEPYEGPIYLRKSEAEENKK
ncbi:MAG: tRNA (adenosine(37)-N6)-threonylcarbamoyltransferase complex dimerization subunit type 1 TsaB [Spirochaetaceae bacterium]|nr:tRNA (adenosine(37)-N6)-threonylcarbamoyltransferase complex dimerization subunit type 1 TsaB [Spirochaetaceae bacterium]